MARHLTVVAIVAILVVMALPAAAAAQEPATFDVTGYTFEDLNHDGYFGGADRPINLVIVRLYRDNAPRGVWDENDVWLNSVRSDASGLYRLPGLTGGAYLIVQDTPTGYDCITGNVISFDLGDASILGAEELSFGNVYGELYPAFGFRTFLPAMQK